MGWFVVSLILILINLILFWSSVNYQKYIFKNPYIRLYQKEVGHVLRTGPYSWQKNGKLNAGRIWGYWASMGTEFSPFNGICGYSMEYMPICTMY